MKLKAENPILFELKPNTSLLDPKFSGYKLSLDSLPSYVHKIESTIDKAVPVDNQYSLLHAKLFTKHNYLFYDQWSSKSNVYFIDKNWIVFKNVFEDGKLIDQCKVWKIPENERLIGRYNITCVFPDPNFIIINDGNERIYLIETGNRDEENNEWKQVYSNTSNKPSIVLDSIKYNQIDSEFIETLYLQIDEKTEWEEQLANKRIATSSSGTHTFVSLLQWETYFRDKNNCWTLKSKRILLGKGGIDYASLERDGQAIYIASEAPFYFVHDSENPIESSQNNTNEEVEPKKPDYIWAQKEKEVTIWIKVPEYSTKNDFIIEINSKNIKIEFQNSVLLEGKFFNDINSEDYKWTLEAGKLEFSLIKVEEERWDKLILDNNSGEEVLDAKVIAEIHSRLASLCSDKWNEDPLRSQHSFDGQQLEECDEYPLDTSLLMRIDKKSQTISHRASLGSHQFLFTVREDPTKVPSICLRHDVDAIIWQPKWKSEVDNNWECVHIGTFSAFGYVQASKQHRRFTMCPKDYSYCAICESAKHIYIYRQPNEIETDLRNRRTGERVSHIAKQQIISIDPPLEILGSVAFKDFLIVLSTENLHTIKINDF